MPYKYSTNTNTRPPVTKERVNHRWMNSIPCWWWYRCFAHKHVDTTMRILIYKYISRSYRYTEKSNGRDLLKMHVFKIFWMGYDGLIPNTRFYFFFRPIQMMEMLYNYSHRCCRRSILSSLYSPFVRPFGSSIYTAFLMCYALRFVTKN